MVLAGDLCQLGPRVRSPLNRDLTSLMQRLSRHPLYRSEGGGRGACFSGTLSVSHRANSKLLDLPSRLFYDGRLSSRSESETLDWGELAPGFPILCWGVDGRQLHRLDSPSYMNAEEAQKVAELCQRLLGETGISSASIGVITPFRAQVLLVRRRLRQLGLGGIAVGQVEDYQGQEEDVVIVSCVSTQAHLGFFDDPRRFNVAVSRPRRLLIVLAHRNLLADLRFAELYKYCEAHGALRGTLSGPGVALPHDGRPGADGAGGSMAEWRPAAGTPGELEGRGAEEGNRDAQLPDVPPAPPLPPPPPRSMLDSESAWGEQHPDDAMLDEAVRAALEQLLPVSGTEAAL